MNGSIELFAMWRVIRVVFRWRLADKYLMCKIECRALTQL